MGGGGGEYDMVHLLNLMCNIQACVNRHGR